MAISSARRDRDLPPSGTADPDYATGEQPAGRRAVPGSAHPPQGRRGRRRDHGGQGPTVLGSGSRRKTGGVREDDAAEDDAQE
jgi:hypothetical protein